MFFQSSPEYIFIKFCKLLKFLFNNRGLDFLKSIEWEFLSPKEEGSVGLEWGSVGRMFTQHALGLNSISSTLYTGRGSTSVILPALEMEARAWNIQGHSWPYNKFKGSLGYIRFYLNEWMNECRKEGKNEWRNGLYYLQKNKSNQR